MIGLTVLELFNYGLVLIYGLFLSVFVAGGWKTQQQKRLVIILCPLLLAIQAVFWTIWDTEVVEKIYPIIVHLPLVLILVFCLKKRVSVAVISVSVGYLCCQLPRWVDLAVSEMTHSGLIGEISYSIFVFFAFFLLIRYFVRAAYEAMSYSKQSLVLFGSLPIAYYVFDYATVVYSDMLYENFRALNEFLPTVLIAFYVVFLTAYHVQIRQKTQAELQKSLLEAELKQSEAEMESLHRVETKTAIYQHDMRHHLTMIEGYLQLGNIADAEEYIRKVQEDVDSVALQRFCENETLNLLCSAFFERAEKQEIRLKIAAKLPKKVSISDTELCSVVSNGLENALHAVQAMERHDKWVEFYCGVKRNKLLIEIKNPYKGNLYLKDGVPTSEKTGHGYGCRSICAIAKQYRGMCTFETENKLFVLRVVLPVTGEAEAVS